MGHFNHPRSSDSIVDFEHAAALKELQELTMTEREWVSPQEPSTTDVDPRPPSLRASRSNSRGSQRSLRHATEQLAVLDNEAEAESQHNGTAEFTVFRDEGEIEEQNDVRKKFAVFKDQHTATQTKHVSPLQPLQTEKAGVVGLHARAKSESSIKKARAVTAGCFRDVEMDVATGQNTAPRHADEDVLDDVRNQPAPPHDFINELCRINDQRAQLLLQLQALDHQERFILSQLVDKTIPSLSISMNSSRSASMARLGTSTTSPLSPTTPTPNPIEMFSLSKPSRIPHKEKLSKPQLPRPVSAPPRSTPSKPRPSSASKRVPLKDKTADESLASVTESIYVSQRLSAVTEGREPANRKSAKKGREQPPRDVGPTLTRDWRGRSAKVPTKFEADEKEEKPKSTVQKKEKAQKTPVRGPSGALLPYTVARKKWEF
ncbi:hypothetical protein P280DRAFT_545739 [Massarina eburnea CBS 473.64]|uniref:Uncharacterized protein n=1 Tax=Massarina eburnea CBS 473.64 TaxID=1395130 RepID=A0A6A6SE78_9PLEO|nr:hypothetical protein P280DRAFT_545739 [Massarina eburnea CBS 473.64]